MPFNITQQNNKCTDINADSVDYPTQGINQRNYNLLAIKRYVYEQMGRLDSIIVSNRVEDIFSGSAPNRLFGEDTDFARADVVSQGSGQVQIQIQSNRGNIPETQYTSLTFASLIIKSSVCNYFIKLNGVLRSMRNWSNDEEIPPVDLSSRNAERILNKFNEFINTYNKTRKSAIDNGVGLVNRRTQPLFKIKNGAEWKRIRDRIEIYRNSYASLNYFINNYRNEIQNTRRLEVGQNIINGLHESLKHHKTYALDFTS